ncbi:MFS transporter [Sedimentibacter saalensis]|uniref:Putative MFS family arabinose efflux permease n=1 Tax=Sedimentibacter saalensis TaxID=130788 RepID=A0A562J4U6_9FIRM|nr:MFS transporter [Sedimentibacter saalensis]TWH78228.1 putative MFS family arabinose efflux permease [Sedimentibacter saalensis]
MKRERKCINSNFLLFLLGRIVSDTGTSIQMMIMPLYIIDIGGTANTVGVFSFLSLLPALLVYPFAGVIGDRLNRKRIMVVTDFISAVVLLGLGWLSYLGTMKLSLLLTVQVIISLMNGLFEPATRGMLPQLVDKEQLTRHNSTVASARSASVLVGPLIGAALYANFGITIVFFANAVSFLLSGISEMGIGYIHIKQKATDGIKGIMNDLSEGIKFVLQNNLIRKLSCFLLVSYFVIQPIFSVMLPLFFKRSLSYTDVQYGYLQTIIILGSLIGSIMIGLLYRKEKRMTKLLVIGSIILLCGMLLFTALIFPISVLTLGNDTIIYFILLATVLGIFSAGNMFISVPVQTFIQQATPNEYMSRVFSLVSMISRGGIPLGALVYGMILEKAEMHWTVLITSVFIVLTFIIFFNSLSRSSSSM